MTPKPNPIWFYQKHIFQYNYFEQGPLLTAGPEVFLDLLTLVKLSSIWKEIEKLILK